MNKERRHDRGRKERKKLGMKGHRSGGVRRKEGGKEHRKVKRKKINEAARWIGGKKEGDEEGMKEMREELIGTGRKKEGKEERKGGKGGRK